MSDKKARRILVVDDEISNINNLCHILLPMYDVVVAKNGQDAVKKANKHLPDLILLDIILPDMTGFDVITLLKNSISTQKIPVIFITGLDSSENEEKGLMLGAVDYITKPFDNSIVKARVKTQFQMIEYINTIERLCMLDALTNISNRRWLDSQLVIEWERAMRAENYLSFIMIDIDHFKKINDTYGHPQGDKLLKIVAGVLEHTLFRPADLVARWGGEEFAVLLPDTDAKGAVEVAERIRTNVEHTAFLCADGSNINVTVSVGVNTEIPKNNGSIEDFVYKADQALYNAKESGKNCVVSVGATK